MGNPEIINYFPGSGIKGIKKSEQALLTTGAALVVEPVTILGVITATGKYGVYDSGESDGTQIPKAVSMSKVDAAGAGDHVIQVILVGDIREENLIIQGGNPGENITKAIKDQLRDYGIIVESYPDDSILDNQ
jgi:hypothetical protein